MSFLKKALNRLFPRDKELQRAIQEITGYTPNNIQYYQTAFSHKSMEQDARENNERLEFLGDSVLSTIISEYLFKKYPFEQEGFLTQLRAKIVSRRQLNNVGRKLNLTKYLNHKETNRGTPQSIHGNTFEALVGAVYLDHGYTKTRNFIKSRILKDLLDIDQIEKTEYDFKSKLHQFAQRQNFELEFVLDKEEKINGKNYFKVSLDLGKRGKYHGKGYSKKSAEQDACEKACQRLKL